MSTALRRCFCSLKRASTERYALSLHDALPIPPGWDRVQVPRTQLTLLMPKGPPPRSEEHTSELQSHSELVCRPLLEKKTQTDPTSTVRPSRTSGRGTR